MVATVREAIAEVIANEAEIQFRIESNIEHHWVENRDEVADAIVQRLREIGYSIVKTADYDIARVQAEDYLQETMGLT